MPALTTAYILLLANSGRLVIPTASRALTDPIVIRDDAVPRLLTRSFHALLSRYHMPRSDIGFLPARMIQQLGRPLPRYLSSSTHRYLEALRWPSRLLAGVIGLPSDFHHFGSGKIPMHSRDSEGPEFTMVSLEGPVNTAL
jgi:hypothetical protein